MVHAKNQGEKVEKQIPKINYYGNNNIQMNQMLNDQIGEMGNEDE